MSAFLTRSFGAVVLLAALSATSCANAGYSVEYAPEYPHGNELISFFGVYEDGRVNDDAWDQFGTRFSRTLAGAPCEVLYGTDFVTHETDLTAAIDAYTRAEGVTDDLLGKIAPMAKGNLVAVFSISGHPPQPLPGNAGRVMPSTASGRNYAGGGGKRGGGGVSNGGMGGGPVGYESGPGTNNDVFEISAKLYSVKDKRSVGVIAMAYNGSSVEEALAKFTDRFQTLMASARCVGWSTDQKVDPEAIRQMIEH